MIRTIFLRAAIFLAAFAVTGTARADTLSDLANGTDPSLTYLSMIWGTGLFPGGSVAVTLLGQVTSAINVIVVGTATAFFTWQLVTGTAQTAHTGKVLGKTWSSLWVPIRFIAAGAMMLPVGQGGYIGVQLVVAWIVKIGVNGGAMAAKLAFTSLAAGVPISAPAAPDYTSIAKTAWDMELCSESLNALRHPYSDLPANGNGVSVQQSTAGDGTVTWAVTQSGNSGNALGPIDVAQCPGLSQSVDQTYGSISQAHVTAVSKLLSGLQPLAQKIVAASRPDQAGASWPTPANLSQAVSAAQTALQTAMATAAQQASTAATTQMGTKGSGSPGLSPGGPSATGAGSALGDAYQSFTSCGFVCVGAYYNMLGAVNAKIVSSVTSGPSVTAGSQYDAESVPLLEADTEAAYKVGDQYWTYSSDPNRQSWTPDGDAYGNQSSHAQVQSASKQAGAADKKGSDVSRIQKLVLEPLAAMVKGFSQAFSGGWVANAGNGASSDPMSRLVSLGAVVSTLATDAEVAISVAAAVAGVEVLGSSLGQSINTFLSAGVGSMLMGCLHLLIYSGNFLLYVLPMMPYFIWIFAIIAYFTLVTEALVAAPFWAFAHLKAGGDGLHGQAEAGYMIVFTLMMRPALMVAGLVASFAIFSIGTEIVTNTYSAAVNSAWSDTGGAPVAMSLGLGGLVNIVMGLAVKLVIFVGLIVVIGERSFALIYKLPDAVSKWFGGGADFGEEGAASQFRGLAAGNVNEMGKLVDGAAGAGAKKLQSGADKEKDKMAQRQTSVALPEGTPADG